MRRVARTLGGLAFALVLVLPSVAHADAVDDAFVRGNTAAERGEWDAAARAYEEAAALLPKPSALVAYNLGTAYAHLGEWGRAVYHLTRATDFQAGPSAAVLDAARENLELVRRRIELQATTEGTVVDRSATSWDLVLESLRAPTLGWVTLLSGWALLLGGAWALRRRRRKNAQSGVLGAVLVLLALLYVVAGLLHGWSLRVDREAPQAIVLDAAADVRDGPGPHRPVEFRLQGGSRVRVVGKSPGWAQVRLPGGLEGWVPDGTVGLLDAPRGVPPGR